MSNDKEAAESASEPEPKEPEKKSLKDAFRELVEPFAALGHTSRSLAAVYITYLIEGLVYFGILTILGKYLSENVGLSDLHAGWVYSLFTGGITLSMLFLGGVSDRIGVRRALLVSLGLLVVGRFFLAASGTFFAQGQGPGSAMFLTVAIGLLVVVVGYGMYQPASYAAVKQFTDEKQATMAYAMIYGLMNLGAFFSGLLSPPIRQHLGIESVYWTYFGLMVVALFGLVAIMTRRVVERDTVTIIDESSSSTDTDDKAGAPAASDGEAAAEPEPAAPKKPRQLFTAGFAAVILGCIVAIGGLVAMAVTAEPGPAAETLDKVKAQLAETADAVTVLADEQTPAALEQAKLPATLYQHAEAMGKLSARIRPPEQLSSGTKVDQVTFDTLRLQVDAQRQLLDQLADQELASFAATVPVDSPQAKEVYASLRQLGVFYMGVAYQLVGHFDHATLRLIERRQSLASEARIDIPDQGERAITDATGKPRPEMLAALADATSQTATRVREALGPGSAALVEVLNAQAAGIRQTAGESRKWPDSLTGLMVQHTYLFGSYLVQSVAPMLITGKEPSQKPLGLAVVAAKLDNDVDYVAHMKSAADDAVKIPLGERLAAWAVRYGILAFIVVFFAVFAILILLRRRPEHPFHDGRFVFFIFILIPVQTLFAHNWLTLPYYINRAFGGTYVGANFEFFSNINPLLIFVLTPFVAALTARRKVYNMMIAGTFVMAVPTFLLVLPPTPATLVTYILLMSIGEAMWQPRFLQWVAEIAPKGQTGAYMGIAQFPWFLTKVVTGLYSGYFLAKYCPLVGPQNTQILWFIYALIAMVSPVALVLARRWMLKGFQTTPAA